MPPKAMWPQLGKVAHKCDEHSTLILTEVNELLQLTGTRTNSIEYYKPFLESIRAYVQKTREQPSPDDIVTELRQGFHKLEAVDTKITLIKNVTDQIQAPKSITQAAKTWAHVAAGTPFTPGSTIAPFRPTATTSFRNREVIVKLTDPVTISALRKTSDSQLKQKVIDAIQSHGGYEPSLIAATHQLKSGDIMVYTKDAEVAKTLQHQAAWATACGGGAKIVERTFGVLIHGVLVQEINKTSSEQVARTLELENQANIQGLKIKYTGWLQPKTAAAKKNSTLVAEFTEPEHANLAIRNGMMIGARLLGCELYDKGCRLKQCFICWKYGHISNQCKVGQLCGFCAEPHLSNDCQNKEPIPPRRCLCAACGGAHSAWSPNCLLRQKEWARIRQAVEARPHYHPERRNKGDLQRTDWAGTARPTLVESQGPSTTPEGIIGNNSANSTTDQPIPTATPMATPTVTPISREIRMYTRTASRVAATAGQTVKLENENTTVSSRACLKK